MSREKVEERYENERNALPHFVQNYLNIQASVPRSTVTLYEYAKEYRRLLEWLISEAIISKQSIGAVALSDFNKLTKNDLLLYKTFLLKSSKRIVADSNKTTRKNATVQRSLTAIRSLFSFLHNEEDENGERLLKRNVMSQIENVICDETMNNQALRIEDKLFLGDKAIGFVEFVAEKYIDTLKSRQAITAYEKNCLRDTAIVALFLGTGMRLSELVNMNVNDFDYATATATVVRKGNLVDPAMISPIFIDYVNDYVRQRKSLYQPDAEEHALFLTHYKRTCRRMETDSVEKMISKYSAAFGTRITPHKLRHSVGTQMYRKTQSLLTVSRQLGQKGTSATQVYTHILNKDQREAIDDLWV